MRRRRRGKITEAVLRGEGGFVRRRGLMCWGVCRGEGGRRPHVTAEGVKEGGGGGL